MNRAILLVIFFGVTLVKADEDKKPETVKLAGQTFEVTKDGLKSNGGEIKIENTKFSVDENTSSIKFVSTKDTDVYWKNMPVVVTVNDKVVELAKPDRLGLTHLPNVNEDDNVTLRFLTEAEAKAEAVIKGLKSRFSPALYWGQSSISGFDRDDCKDAVVTVAGKTVTVTMTITDKMVAQIGTNPRPKFFKEEDAGKLVVKSEGKKDKEVQLNFSEFPTIVLPKGWVTITVTSTGNP